VRVLRVKRLVNKGVHWWISNFPQWIYTDQNSAHKVVRLLILYLSPLSQVVQDPWLVYVEQSSHVCYYFRVLREHVSKALQEHRERVCAVQWVFSAEFSIDVAASEVPSF
jgi:hypothetical protein